MTGYQVAKAQADLGPFREIPRLLRNEIHMARQLEGQ